jgi:hypothetical protein
VLAARGRRPDRASVPWARLALIALTAALAGCQDYAFNPVAACILATGSTRVTLSDQSSADILFVVDDSPSMDPKQAGLAASFGDFIGRVVQTNTDRVAHGLVPVDLHIAVTTSSVFLANPSGTYCQGGTTCCRPGSCIDAACTPGTSAGCGGGQLCVAAEVVSADGLSTVGEKEQCCDVSACAPAANGCRGGDACASMVTAYPVSPKGCTPGVSTGGAPYPRGAFVAAPGNPIVLHLDKTLDWASWGTAAQDPRLTAVVQQFKQNIQVGSCGSGEEQHLEAARLALQAAWAGTQPGVAKGTWPHPGAKLVVVWVGDEDDCSSPSAAPVVLTTSTPGADSCVWDKHRPAASQREVPVSTYASFLDGLVSQGAASGLGAAFIVSSARCADGTYLPADACTGTPLCPVTPPAACQAPPMCGGAFAAGERFLALAGALRALGHDLVEGSVCDAYPPRSFGPTLAAIADLATPPSSLELPTQPEAAAVTVLRIVEPSGTTRKICTPGTDWCFVDCVDRSAAPACLAPGVTSRCIAINHVTGACEANPGESYSAEYLGALLANGCAAASDCQAVLGGAVSDWDCYTAPGEVRGACVCAR